jgi:hypothetical protein
MAHTFLSLDVRKLIPKTTKDNVPTFWMGLFSNDGVKGGDGKWLTEPSRMLIDGRNAKGELVHPEQVLLAWTQWSDNPTEIIQVLLDDAIEYTSEEFRAIKNDVSSIWYTEAEVLI